MRKAAQSEPPSPFIYLFKTTEAHSHSGQKYIKDHNDNLKSKTNNKKTFILEIKTQFQKPKCNSKKQNTIAKRWNVNISEIKNNSQ